MALPQERLIVPLPKLDAGARLRYLEQRVSELQRAISLYFVGKGSPLNNVDSPIGGFFSRVDGSPDYPAYGNKTGGKPGWAPFLLEPLYIPPTTLTLNAGTGTGSIANVQVWKDGNVYHIDEAAATPGINVSFTFDNVTLFRWLFISLNYYGAPTTLHNLEIGLYNYTAAQWYVVDSVYGNTVSTKSLLIPIPTNVGFISGGAQAAIRIYHPSAGSANHDLDIDCIFLVK